MYVISSTFRESFSTKCSLPTDLWKFSPLKVSCYMVYLWESRILPQLPVSMDTTHPLQHSNTYHCYSSKNDILFVSMNMYTHRVSAVPSCWWFTEYNAGTILTSTEELCRARHGHPPPTVRHIHSRTLAWRQIINCRNNILIHVGYSWPTSVSMPPLPHRHQSTHICINCLPSESEAKKWM